MSLLHSVLRVSLRFPTEGEPKYETLAESTSQSVESGSAEVIAAYHELLSSTSEAAEDRRKYASCLLIVDNALRASHDFPDLEAADQKAVRSAEIKAASAQKDQAASEISQIEEQLAAAKASEADAKAKLSNLTGEPIEVEEVPEETPEPIVPKDSGKGNDDDPPSEKVAVIIARFESGDLVTPDDLADLEISDLKALAARYAIEIPESADHATMIEIILSDDSGEASDVDEAVEAIAEQLKIDAGTVTAEQLNSALTVLQLKALAERFEIEIPKEGNKPDIIGAILGPDAE